ncbi:MAG: DUF2085 domain-containing protein [Balneolaceae bacterium]
MSHKKLFFGVLVALCLLVLFSLGGGIWGAQSTIGHWTGELFQGICHQNPMRSYYVNDLQMAVNSRCFGVFIGLLIGWISIPLMLRAKVKKNLLLWFLLLAVIVQIIDFAGNLIQIWENSNLTRLILGGWLGFATTSSVYDLFQTNN